MVRACEVGLYRTTWFEARRIGCQDVSLSWEGTRAFSWFIDFAQGSGSPRRVELVVVVFPGSGGPGVLRLFVGPLLLPTHVGLSLLLSASVSSSFVSSPRIRDHLLDRTRVTDSNVYSSALFQFQPYGKFHGHQHPCERPRWAPHHHPAATNNHCLFQNRTVSAHHLCLEFLIYSLHTCFPYRLRHLRKWQHIPCWPNGWKDSRNRYQHCMGCIRLAAEQCK
jgi:hypothetical protein